MCVASQHSRLSDAIIFSVFKGHFATHHSLFPWQLVLSAACALLFEPFQRWRTIAISHLLASARAPSYRGTSMNIHDHVRDV
jgi:hypothetical protein